jgi:simple sugar transport system permease protein
MDYGDIFRISNKSERVVYNEYGIIKKGFADVAAIGLGLVAGLIAAVFCGLINGIIIAYVRVNPMMATLGTMMLYEGIALRVTNGSSITGFPEAYQLIGAKSILSLPIPVILMAVTIVIVYLLMERTAWGEHIYFCGCNYTATEYSGVNVKSTLIKAYVLSAVLSMMAAVLMTSRYNSAKVDYGSSYLMMALTAVLLGGTDIAGGYGKVVGTVIGVAIIQVTSNGLNIFGANRYLVNVVTGFILLFVLAIKYFAEMRKGMGVSGKRKSGNC